MRRLTGRVSEVHKTLVSASRSASYAQNGWITKGGGWLVPDDSAASHKIKKVLESEAQKANHKMVPLYEEKGVYNFYFKARPGKSKVEPLEESADLKSLSRDELEKEIEKLRKLSGFPGHP